MRLPQDQISHILANHLRCLQIDTFLRQIAQKKVDNAAKKPIVQACRDIIGGTVLLNGKFPGVSTRGNPGVFDGTKRPIVELAENLTGDDKLLNGQSEMVFLAENLNGIKLQVSCGRAERRFKYTFLLIIWSWTDIMLWPYLSRCAPRIVDEG